ncbi:hypothetical protein [Asanoa siamensis]|uniref:Uncharacterized protein n=1 Tax=Asanoa siamensis TaxID=926357 RepID=A0ABQ4CVH4_9ACTN|nr:hypothetical protein [Asanoa siamensis]GIF75265.1 hypothetical protein Asi02nite_47830 [Asanoa siamensis]
MSFVAPDACTLPTAEQPLRVAEFESLFAGRVESVSRADSRHARIVLHGSPGLADRVRDLTARENECCAFFGFTITADAAAPTGSVTLAIEVPAAYADVLDGLARLAETGRAG